MNTFNWLNDTFLKMTWLNELMGRFVENVLGVDIHGRVGASIQFFLFDTIKIFILLIGKPVFKRRI